nr:hypothetical protein CFP56_52429 [Quercus suber]
MAIALPLSSAMDTYGAGHSEKQHRYHKENRDPPCLERSHSRYHCLACGSETLGCVEPSVKSEGDIDSVSFSRVLVTART